MAGNISLKTYKGGNVTPQDDAIIHETAIPGSGIFKGCEVTYARGNVLHISQGFGMIQGRFFEVYETEIAVRLAQSGETLDGRVYIHLDLSNADEPVKILAQSAAELPPLDMDLDINYNNSSYDLELAVFTVSSVGLDNLTKVFQTLKSGGGGGNSLARAAYYYEGDTAAAAEAPGWVTLVCVQAGTTAAVMPSGYKGITKAGDKVLDGTAVFEARNVMGELDSVISSVSGMGESLTELDKKVEGMTGSAELVLKLVSLEEYCALGWYGDTTVYLCYEDSVTRRVTRIFVGKDKVYMAGVKVTYQIDTGRTLEKTVPYDGDAVADAPDAVLAGYSLVGWRLDDSAEADVLTECIISEEEPVTALYAVFKKQEDIDIKIRANNGTPEEQSFEAESVFRCYNNGNSRIGPVQIPECPYEKEGKSFCGWSADTFSTPAFKPGQTAYIPVLPDGAALYAMWVDTELDYFRAGFNTFIIPQDGIYEFEVWGAQGGRAYLTVEYEDKYVGEGGLGGYSKGYKRMKKDDVIYIDIGFSGGNTGNSGSASKEPDTWTYNARGGGGSRITTTAGSIPYKDRSAILLTAGGGGGGYSYRRYVERNVGKGGDGGGERGGNGSAGSLGGRQMSTGNSPESGFGTTANYNESNGGNGGGGWFMGESSKDGSGAGGSGYIGGVAPFYHNGKYYPAETVAGVNEGNGKARIRYVECV